jgi:hypothetical protein
MSSILLDASTGICIVGAGQSLPAAKSKDSLTYFYANQLYDLPNQSANKLIAAI